MAETGGKGLIGLGSPQGVDRSTEVTHSGGKLFSNLHKQVCGLKKGFQVIFQNIQLGTLGFKPLYFIPAKRKGGY